MMVSYACLCDRQVYITNVLLLDKNQPYRLQVLHDNKKCDIRRAQWIVDCVAANDLLPLEPR